MARISWLRRCGAIVMLLAAAQTSGFAAGTITVTGPTLDSTGTRITFGLLGAARGIRDTIAAGFSVYANGIRVPSGGAVLSRGVLTLPLPLPVLQNSLVTLKYDCGAMGAPPITDPAGSTVGYFDNLPVANGSAVKPALTLTNPQVSADGLSVTATVAGNTGALKLAPDLAGGWTPYGFDVLVGNGAGVPVLVKSAQLAGSVLTLSLANRIWSGAAVKVGYRNVGIGSLVDSAVPANALGTLGLTPAANNSKIAQTVFLDTLTGPLSTDMTTHVPDVGSSWSVTNGVAPWTLSTVPGGGVFAHEAAVRAGSAIMQPNPSPLSANYCVSADIYLDSLAGSITLYSRYDGAHGYSVTFTPATGVVIVNKLGSGWANNIVYTGKLPSACVIGQTYTFSISCHDTLAHDSRGGSSVASYDVVRPGSQYASWDPVSTASSDAAGSGAVASASSVDSAVVSVVPVSYGSGYTAPPNVVVAGGSGAVVTGKLASGQPSTVISVCLALGSKQPAGSPIVKIIDSMRPWQDAGTVAISAYNSGPNQGAWVSNVRVDYAQDGNTPVQPQNQYLSSWTDGAYSDGYSTFHATLNCLPSLDGVPPYSYKLFRGAAMAGNDVTDAVLVHDFGQSPGSLIYTDSPPYAQRAYEYFYQVTDATQASGYTNQAGERQYVAVRRDTPLDIFHIGTSISAGGYFFPNELSILMHTAGVRTVNGITELTPNVMPALTYWSGKSGSSSRAWLPVNPYLPPAEANINLNHCSVVSIELGANDCRDGQAYNSLVPPAVYGANLSAICADILAKCPTVKKIILQYPFGAEPWSNGGGNIWQPDSMSRVLEYQEQIDQIANGTTIFAADNGLFAMFQSNTSLFSDGVHPSAAQPLSGYSGAQWMGICWGNAIARILFPTTPAIAGSVSQVAGGSTIQTSAATGPRSATRPVGDHATIVGTSGTANSVINDPQSKPVGFGAAAPYNAFVFGNVLQSGSTIEGREAVGGNAILSQCDIAAREPEGAALVVAGIAETDRGALHGGLTAAGDLSLYDPTVDGDVSGASGVFFTQYGKVDGSVVYGTTYSPGTTTVAGGASHGVTVLPIDFNAASVQLTELSDRCAAFSAQGAVSDNDDAVTLTGSDKRLNVFTLSPETLSNAHTLTISVPAGSTALLNVSGSAIDLRDLTVVLKGIDARHVLVNFPWATTLKIGSAHLQGSLLAPRGAVTLKGGTISGTLISQALTTGTGQLNDYPFTGDLRQP